MFIHYNNQVVNSSFIDWIDYKNLVSSGYIVVYYTNGWSESISGPEAISIMMELCPDALEGKQAKYVRHAWAIHNLIGHPLMQIFSWLGLTRLGVKIHDETVPNPITK